MSNTLHGEVGDVIEVAAAHLGESRRVGEILEVLGSSGHEHYRVRWEDGRETLFYPGSGSGVMRRARPAEKKPVHVHEP